MAATTLQSETLVQKENILEAKFSTSGYTSNSITKSPEYCICGIAQFQVLLDITQIPSSYDFKRNAYVKFKTLHHDDALIYFIKLSSISCSLEDKMYMSDESEWRLVHSSVETTRNPNITYAIDVSVKMGVVIGPSLFQSLYEDEAKSTGKEVESPDFQLRGKDGSVDVHRAVLAAYSPVLRAMLAGEWRESSEGTLQLSGTSQETLQHLRDYMYLHRLPDSGLETLLALAATYMITELMKLCSVKMLLKLNDENHIEYLELATRYKLKTMLLGIQESLKRGNIEPTSDHKYFLDNDWLL